MSLLLLLKNSVAAAVAAFRGQLVGTAYIEGLGGHARMEGICGSAEILGIKGKAEL